MKPGTYNMHAVSGKEQEFKSEEQVVTLKEGKKGAALTFQLKGRPGIKGKIIFPEGEETDNVQLYYIILPGGASPDLGRLKENGTNNWVSKYNDFSYSFKDIPAGTYLLGVAHGYNSEIIASQVVDLSDQMGRFGSSKKVGKDGRITFSNLPAGEYKLRSYGMGKMEEMRINLQGDLEIRYEPKEMNALEVMINDEKGSLAEVGFKDGDLVIGLDGKEFDKGFEMQMAFMQIMSKKEVNLLVLRDGRRLEIKIEPKKLMGNMNQGGRMEPTSR